MHYKEKGKVLYLLDLRENPLISKELYDWGPSPIHGGQI